MARREAAAVLDASVAAKWFLLEEDTESAISLRDAHLAGEVRLVTPALMFYEVANALRYHPRMGSDTLREIIGELLGLNLGVDEVAEESLVEAVRTAYRAGLSVYDAHYLALAERVDGPLYTADDRQLRAAPSRAVHIRQWSPDR